MKNIHILPTDKPSRLYYWEGKLRLGDLTTAPKNLGISNQNIYITSDEEIKEGDWFYQKRTNQDDVVKRKFESVLVNENCKKIVLTNNNTLIENNVQEVDDEFLRWLVKNPTCENIEVKKEYITPLGDIVETCYDNERLNYKITIPKEEPTIEEEYLKDELKKYDGIGVVILNKPEEPKQETLEEAVQKVANSDDFINGALFGSLWQQERMYSEEEVIKILLARNADLGIIGKTSAVVEFIKQFKKNKI